LKGSNLINDLTPENRDNTYHIISSQKLTIALSSIYIHIISKSYSQKIVIIINNYHHEKTLFH